MIGAEKNLRFVLGYVHFLHLSIWALFDFFLESQKSLQNQLIFNDFRNSWIKTFLRFAKNAKKTTPRLSFYPSSRLQKTLKNQWIFNGGPKSWITTRVAPLPYLLTYLLTYFTYLLTYLPDAKRFLVVSASAKERRDEQPLTVDR